MKFYCKIINGQLNNLELTKQLAKWNNKEVIVEIKLDKATRSNNQNRYYWEIVVGLISECTGYEPDEVHEMLKQEFIGEKRLLGDKTFTVATTTNQTTIEFEDYLSKIRAWASKTLACYIPLPNENY